jgi:methyltransferase (TIGR00027 family)
MDEPGDRLPAVGVTGVGVAAIRAAESSRPDRLFDDPFAARFAAAAGWAGPRGEPSRRRRLSTWIAVRTRFLDDVILGACAGGCRQVVILGAGLDARSFRLPWPPGTHVWELDLPSVLEFKEQVVRSESWQPSCRRTTVPVDLAGPWGRALVDGGLDTEAPVAWVAEGLLAYLTPEVGDRIVSVAAELSVPTSRLGLTVASPARLRAWRRAHPDGRAGPGDYVALWRSTGPADPASWLASHGWQAQVYATAERSAAYGRAADKVGEPEGEMSGAGLVDATRC